MSDWFDSSDAIAMADAVRAGDVSRRELVELSLRRVDDRNSRVNAIVELRADAALEEAERASGPLAGVPFIVKDLGVDVAGMRSTSGSRLRATYVAQSDSEIVRRYRAAGLVIIGTTAASEFGRSPSTETALFGPTRNPHAPGRSAGGSSGGTAAAVAARIVPAGHGNDGGGSIRIPAAMCGLVGLKPSRARTPAFPRRTAFAYPVGVNHALTRSVRDSALLLDIAEGSVPGDSTFPPAPAGRYLDALRMPPPRTRVAVSLVRPDGLPVDEAAASATLDVAHLLESLGHDVVDATPRYPVESVREVMRVVMAVSVVAEVDSTLAQLGRPLRDDDIEPFTRALYEIGRTATAAELFAALQHLEQSGHDLAPFFTEHDVLLTPTVPVPTPPIGLLDTADVAAMYQHAAPYASLTSFCNVTGQPAISLPIGRWPDGMPLGIQLITAVGREDLLLRLAAQLEYAEPWDQTPVLATE